MFWFVDLKVAGGDLLEGSGMKDFPIFFGSCFCWGGSGGCIQWIESRFILRVALRHLL